MLIRDTTWSKIRELFTENEKMDLRKCITGETICPHGFIINENDLTTELRKKLKAAL
jgi:hypothetical protein